MRRPARLERAGALTPRDRMWAAIRRFGLNNEFSVAEIMLLTRHKVEGKDETLCASTVLPYLEGLSNAKPPYIEAIVWPRPEVAPVRECGRFRLRRDVGVQAPNVRRDGTPSIENVGQQQMWDTARKFKGAFTWIDLTQCCPSRPTMGTVKSYLKFLARAGYLRVVTKGKGGKPSEFTFIKSRDTGPKPPLITADKSVMDANTSQIVLAGGKRAGAANGK